MFLLSRTEVLRLLDIEPGRTIAITGAPREFLEWLDQGLPEGVLIDPSSDSIGHVDVHIIWTDGPAEDAGIRDRIVSAFSRASEVWMVFPQVSPLTRARSVTGFRTTTDHQLTEGHLLSRVDPGEIENGPVPHSSEKVL